MDFGGVRREVCLAYVADEVQAGDYVVVHVGFAISKVDEEEAQRGLEPGHRIGAAEEEGVEGGAEDLRGAGAELEGAVALLGDELDDDVG